jgi:acetyl esterase
MTLTFDTMDYFIKHYLNSSNDAVNWEASPLFAKNLHNLPETFIFAAGLDPLLDEGIAYANRLKSFGNKVTYKLYPGQIHGFLSNSIHFPKATECIKEIGKAANSMVLKKRG